MKLSRSVRAFVTVLLLSPALLASEDLTGKWSGAFNTSINGGAPSNETMYLVLKHAGKELTGTAGPTADLQWAIQKGTVVVAGAPGKETTKISFDLPLGDGVGPLLHVELELVDGRLKGSASAEQEGMKMFAIIDVGRVK